MKRIPQTLQSNLKRSKISLWRILLTHFSVRKNHKLLQQKHLWRSNLEKIQPRNQWSRQKRHILMIRHSATSHFLRSVTISWSWRMGQHVSYSRWKPSTFSSSLNKNKIRLSIHFSTFSMLSSFRSRSLSALSRSILRDTSIASRRLRQARKTLFSKTNQSAI